MYICNTISEAIFQLFQDKVPSSSCSPLYVPLSPTFLHPSSLCFPSAHLPTRYLLLLQDTLSFVEWAWICSCIIRASILCSSHTQICERYVHVCVHESSHMYTDYRRLGWRWVVVSTGAGGMQEMPMQCRSVKREGTIVGHLPWQISCACTLFMRHSYLLLWNCLTLQWQPVRKLPQVEKRIDGEPHCH